MPLPPYIAGKRAPDDRDREDYQTIWAKRAGAVAAPTASLHFDEPLVAALTEAGIDFTFVTLHVGAGTFLPVTVDDVTTHRMHAEWGEVREKAAQEINETRAAGGRIIPRGHHGAAPDRDGGEAGRHHAAFRGRHGYLHLSRLRVEGDRRADDEFPPAEIDPHDAGFGADGARAGDGDLRRHAIGHEYRFFSYGDASLLIPSVK